MSERAGTDSAANWAIRLEERPLMPAEQQELDAWLAAAPHHYGALIRARAVWRDLDRLGALQQPGRAPIPEGRAETPIEASKAAPEGSLRRRWLGGLAASIAALSIAAFAYRSQLMAPDEYETRIGEVRRIALADGSAITLNSDSQAMVKFEKTQRIVHLRRGEALFEVAKDRSRPFLVWSGQVSVRAVGTVFAVHNLPENILVTVAEGTVEIVQPEEPAQRVTVNERATVRPQRIIDVASEDASVTLRQLSWRSGQLSFSGESLGDAVREMNRYSKRQIEIEDPALAARPVVGIFRIGDVDAFAQAAAVALNAEVHADDRSVRLSTPEHP
jgi:transmembrane sensor